MCSSLNDPIDVLVLSIRSYNALKRGGIRTVKQLAKMSDQEIQDVRNVGIKAFTEIKEKLRDYLIEHSLSTEFSLSGVRPESPTIAQRRAATFSSTSLEVLNLSIRSYNALKRGGIKTVEQLARMSEQEIWDVWNIGIKSLIEIEGKLRIYLAEHPLPSRPATPEEKLDPLLAAKPASPAKESQSPPPPSLLADQKILDCVEEKGIPLDEISIERLALTGTLGDLLREANIETICELAQQPRDKRGWGGRVTESLNRYLTWLIGQDETVWANEVAGRGIS